MLESHHSLVVRALQRLYKLCVEKEGFPGEPLVESPDGYPLTHAILDRLGLIKQAEENAEETEEDSEDLQYLRFLSTSTDSATTDPSPEPATPPDPSPSTCSPVDLSPKTGGPWKWDYQAVQPVQYPSYQASGFQGMTMPRSTMEPHGITADTKCPESVSTVPDHDHSYFYYMNNSPTGQPINSRLHQGVSVEPVSHHASSTVGMTTDVVSDYSHHNHQLNLPEQHGLYTNLTPNWSYPCG